MAGSSGKCPTTAALTITSQPQSQAVNLGANVTVVASGTAPLTYQWRFNGNTIAGATGTSFTTNNVQLASAGNYSVVVSNTGGSTNSANAALTILPLVTSQPQSQDLGANVTFSVNAAGTSPLTYQWSGAARCSGTALGATG